MKSPTIFNFLIKFILKSKKQLFILTLTAFAIITKSLGKIEQQRLASVMADPKKVERVNIPDIIHFTAISIIYIVSVPLLELLAVSFDTTLFKGVFDSSYIQFLKYKYNDWNSNLDGDLYSIILRRCIGVSRYFKYKLFDVTDNLAYIFVNIASSYRYFGFARHINFGIAACCAAPIVINLLSLCRNMIERRYNSAFDKGEMKLKDIFFNYEMIHTYNTFDKELANYRSLMITSKLWFIFYWLFNDFIKVISDLSKIFLIAVVYYQIDRTAIEQSVVFYQLVAFQSLSKRINSLSENLKLMVEAKENILNCKLDQLKTKMVNGTTFKQRMSSFESSLNFIEMSKSYGTEIIFKNANFKINKGEKIAITGANGSGKSSFVKSLVGLEPYSGEISFDGINIKNINEKDIAKILTFVPQENAIFDATVYENLTCFDKKISPETVYSTISDFGMTADFKAIGFTTYLTQGDSNVSAVQRKKICFIRAILRDTPILVFDEVTSSMDKEYESYLFQKILNNLKDKTVIMIIHNLKLLPKFDKVIYFGNKTASDSLPFDCLVSENLNFKEYLNGSEVTNK